VTGDEEGRVDDDSVMDATGEGRVDGNAVGGMLAMVFGHEMTSAPGRCAHCGTVNEMGAMHVYMRGPGVVVRCPACGEVVLRVVETATAMFLDARGVAFVRIERERA
jgi:ribosomal protein S27E